MVKRYNHQLRRNEYKFDIFVRFADPSVTREAVILKHISLVRLLSEMLLILNCGKWSLFPNNYRKLAFQASQAKIYFFGQLHIWLAPKLFVLTLKTTAVRFGAVFIS